MINSVFFWFGNLAPLILFGFSVCLLRKKPTLLYYYVIGFFLNSLLNVFLKIAIQQPRPNIDVTQFNIALTNFKTDIFVYGIPDIFGMPSGHTQTAIFSTIFIFLSLRNQNILLLYLFVTFITMWQRVCYNFHTIYQVLFGFIVGCIFAYFMFLIAQQNIIGVIKQKTDDYAIL